MYTYIKSVSLYNQNIHVHTYPETHTLTLFRGIYFYMLGWEFLSMYHLFQGLANIWQSAYLLNEGMNPSLHIS